MNSQATLSRELALRIGLAARVLPDTDAKALFAVLQDCVGLPITDTNLSGITLTAFKAASAGALAHIEEALLKQALHLLKHPLADADPAPVQPEIHHLQPEDLAGSVRIACASDDGVNVDGHFGACKQFLIYQVAADHAHLIGIRATDSPDSADAEDKNTFRAELLRDCQVVYMASVGGPAAAKIVKLGIHPMKLSASVPIAEIIAQLQTVIAGTPPPWLAKAMGIEASDRFRFLTEARA